MAEYNSSKELEGFILKESDIINFFIKGERYQHFVSEHSRENCFFINYDGDNNSIVKILKIISCKEFIYKKVGYYDKVYNGFIYVNNLDDLTKITIDLFKMCEKY